LSEPGLSRKPGVLFWIVLVLLTVGAGLLSVVTGPMNDPPEWVLLKLRLPRLALALLSGASLSVAGCVLQSILRNDLATPYTLGISAGAGLAAGSIIVAGAAVPVLGMVAAGTGGALLAVFAVFFLASISRGGDTGATLLLAGVTINLIGASILLLLEYFSDADRILEIVRWMMGDLAVVGWSKPLFLLPATLVGIVLVLCRTGVLNQVAQGDEMAASRGVSVRRERNLLLAASALLAGATVGVAGPVGFVGLIVPHVMRKLCGADYRTLVPASAVGGMLLVVSADILSRMVISPAEIPIGITMALLGGPFFLALLIRGADRRG
jgi:iron complex transport system permease protein